MKSRREVGREVWRLVTTVHKAYNLSAGNRGGGGGLKISKIQMMLFINAPLLFQGRAFAEIFPGGAKQILKFQKWAKTYKISIKFSKSHNSPTIEIIKSRGCKCSRSIPPSQDLIVQMCNYYSNFCLFHAVCDFQDGRIAAWIIPQLFPLL